MVQLVRLIIISTNDIISLTQMIQLVRLTDTSSDGTNSQTHYLIHMN